MKFDLIHRTQEKTKEVNISLSFSNSGK